MVGRRITALRLLLAAVCGLLVYCLVAFRERPGHRARYFHGDSRLHLLITAVLSALWYAPLLVAWHGVAAVKAAFFSAAAIVLNWRAMLALGCALALALLALSLLALAVASLIARSEQARISTAAFAATWTFLPILFAASWRSYEAIFGVAPAAGQGDTGAEAD